MMEIEAVSQEIRRRENAVLRAAVKRQYDTNPSDGRSPTDLDIELASAVEELVAAMPALPVRRRK